MGLPFSYEEVPTADVFYVQRGDGPQHPSNIGANFSYLQLYFSQYPSLQLLFCSAQDLLICKAQWTSFTEGEMKNHVLSSGDMSLAEPKSDPDLFASEDRI